jgi:sulfur relay (sulfurtransferase) complex TusBCD TusD component (DsrE family)
MEKTKDDIAMIVCDNIEKMRILPVERHHCSVCAATIGVTSESKKMFDTVKGKKSYVCWDCFKQRGVKDEDIIIKPSAGQLTELEEHFRGK